LLFIAALLSLCRLVLRTFERVAEIDLVKGTGPKGKFRADRRDAIGVGVGERHADRLHRSASALRMKKLRSIGDRSRLG
jgi:hypothetical protein